MNKKVVLIIILAGILALIGAFVIWKLYSAQTLPVFEEKTISTLETERVEEVSPRVETSKQEVTEVKSNVTQTKPTPVKKVFSNKTVSKPTAQELPVVKPIVVKEVVPEQTQNEVVIKEESSNDIVITKEYKMQSPAKYSFK